MRSEPQSAALVTILFALTLALGLTFGGTGGGSASHVRTNSAPPSGTPTATPKVIVIAHGVNPVLLYQTSALSKIPSDAFFPLAGLHAVFTSLSTEAVSFRQRVPGVTLTTNATGVAVGFMAPGNYTCLIAGKNFRLNSTVSFKVNSTNTIRFDLIPSAVNVTVLHIVSPDSATEVEPQTRVTALLSNQSAPSLGFAELVGSASAYWGPGAGITVEGLTFNATVVGWYPGNGGFWAVLIPSGSPPKLPTNAVVLFQLKPVIEVKSTVG